MALKEILNAVTMEQGLEPGTELELEYIVLTKSPTLVGGWLSLMEPQLEKQEPLWQYLGYAWNPGTARVTFKMRLRDYQMDINTREIIALDPVTMEPAGSRVTMYYASGAWMNVFVLSAASGIAVMTFLSLVEVRKIVRGKSDDTSDDLTPGVMIAQAGSGLVLVAVAIALWYLWRWSK